MEWQRGARDLAELEQKPSLGQPSSPTRRGKPSERGDGKEMGPTARGFPQHAHRLSCMVRDDKAVIKWLKKKSRISSHFMLSEI